MDVEYGDDQEFIDLATRSRLNLEATFAALEKVVADGSSTGASSTTTAMLQSAGGDVKALARELLEKVEDVGQAIDRCDIFELVGNLIEVSFEIGATVSKERALAEAKAEARKKLGAEGGKASGKRRTEASDQWKTPILEVAKTLSARSIDALTTKAMSALPVGAPNPPSHSVAYEFLRQEIASERLVFVRKR